MRGWRRSRPAGAPAGPAVLPSARPRDDWRTLPPLPTVLRSAVTTVTAGTFSDSLSTWHDPSFLAPLVHHVDPHGPAGLVTGLAGTATRPEPLTYHYERPLPLAGGGPASLQRTVARWQPPSRARSPLTAASGVDLGPVSLIAVPEEPEATSAEPVAAVSQEPERPGTLAEPPVIPALPTEDPATGSADAGQASAPGQTSPGGPREVSAPPERPLLPRRESGDVTAQRQVTPIPPQAPPKRRLGLGAPLNDPRGSTPARTVPAPDQPVIARSVGWPALRDPGDRTPHAPVPSEPEREPRQEQPAPAPAGWPAASAAAPEPAGATPDTVQRALADQAGPEDPGSPGPGPAEAAPAGEPPTEAPLTGEVPLASHALRPPSSPPATTAASPATPLPESTLFPGTTPSPPAQVPLAANVRPRPPAAWAAVQRSPAPPGASPGTPLVRPPTASAPEQTTPDDRQETSRPPADPGLAHVVPPDPYPADLFAGPLISVQRLPSGSPDAAILPRPAEVAPLLGHRQPTRILDASPGAASGSRATSTSAIPDTPPPVPMQRSVPAPSPTRLDGPAWASSRGPAATHWGPSAGYPDPGEIAVARGLARREPDGSVVFDLSSAPLPSDPLPPAGSIEPGGWVTPAGSMATVQRQEAGAEPGDMSAPSPGSVLTTTAPASSAAPAPSAQPGATPASGAATPPLDELARQLFGPLTARLKAELRLDRERAGLLTDLRQ